MAVRPDPRARLAVGARGGGAQARLASATGHHLPCPTERGRQGGYIGGGHAEQVNHIEWWLSYELWRVITCSQFMAAQVNSYFGAPSLQDRRGAQWRVYRAKPVSLPGLSGSLEFRRRYADDDWPLVFYVCRPAHGEGPACAVLHSWPQVLAAFPKAQLVIAGTGAYLDSLKHRAWAMSWASLRRLPSLALSPTTTATGCTIASTLQPSPRSTSRLGSSRSRPWPPVAQWWWPRPAA